MTKTDTPLALPEDIRTACMLLTRLPMTAGATSERMKQAAWAFPLAGLLLALLAGLIGGLGQWSGLPASLTALLVLATVTIISGAMHEDGLADTADGFWGGWDRPRRLEIMKDSHIGTYGVIALLLSFGARWAALVVIIGQGNWLWPVIAVACLSRAAMPVVMHSLPNARTSGLSHHAGRPDRNTVLLGIVIAVTLAVFTTGLLAFKLVILCGLATVAMAALARHKIGGQTGDVLGATQQICEITLLAALCV